ncbi:hypothetical protein TTHERM_00239120 (macronuclear) [Tetrahymena thermophila SB210]|uniref:Uncharacterized protein n=1 Tax=Tetrahymena thermophila (strain SB210) TaxID=312017 RepID=I7M3Z3_TETTS|nr:hypothetical protein TTHERM_00239120 [Tetrahymena thermophila SB210]EAS04591.2 hypothetical protein TTHERM_00239120 [Tetrahymena thermophila SB210]|eukprot:XP_001024836.2 hypothetical protein TTHERM_00239120 [Tetrahymena thermophila SB210]
MNSSAKSLQPINECQQIFSQTINFSSRNSLNTSQNNHKRTLSLNGKENNSSNKSNKKQSGFKIFKKSSQNSTLQNEECDNSYLENSFCGSQKPNENINNSFKNQHTSVLELDHFSHNLPSTIPQNKSSNLLNVEVNSFNENLNCSNNFDGVFKQIDLSHYQSQLSNLQSKIQTLNEINIKESAEFGGNLKNKIAEINCKANKNGTFNGLNLISNLNNNYQNSFYSDKENYQSQNFQREEKNVTISKILERMNQRFEEIEQKMDNLIQQNQRNKSQQEDHANSQVRMHNQIDSSVIQKLNERIEKLEQKMQIYDCSFLNYKKQIEINLSDFQQIVQKSLVQFMEKSEQIEKKMGIVQIKISNDLVIKQNYESIIERLNKINQDFNDRFSQAESQTHRKEEQISMEVYNHSERLNALEREINKFTNTLGDSIDKNSNYKWLSDEINYVKNRQVQFLSMLMEISTLVGLK